MLIETPVLLTGKINLRKSLNETFNDTNPKPFQYMVMIRVPLNSENESEKAFVDKVKGIEKQLIEQKVASLKAEGKNCAIDKYRVVIDPTSPSFSEYTTNILSKSDYTLRLRAKCRPDSPKLKAYQIIQIVDAKGNMINTEDGLNVFTDGCAVKAYFKMVPYCNQNKVGVSTSLVGLQYCGAGEPFMADKIDFVPYTSNASDISESDMSQFI